MSRRAMGMFLGMGHKGTEGATTVEYGILVAAVGTVLIATGPELLSAFEQLLLTIVRGMLS